MATDAVNNNGGGLTYEQQNEMFAKQQQADAQSFQRQMALINLQRQQQEQNQLISTISNMVKNDGENKMAVIRNLKTG